MPEPDVEVIFRLWRTRLTVMQVSLAHSENDGSVPPRTGRLLHPSPSPFSPSHLWTSQQQCCIPRCARRLGVVLPTLVDIIIRKQQFFYTKQESEITCKKKSCHKCHNSRCLCHNLVLRRSYVQHRLSAITSNCPPSAQRDIVVFFV